MLLLPSLQPPALSADHCSSTACGVLLPTDQCCPRQQYCLVQYCCLSTDQCCKLVTAAILPGAVLLPTEQCCKLVIAPILPGAVLLPTEQCCNWSLQQYCLLQYRCLLNSAVNWSLQQYCLLQYRCLLTTVCLRAWNKSFWESPDGPKGRPKGRSPHTK